MATVPALREPRPRPALIPAAVLALAVEGGLLAGALAWLMHEHTPPPPAPSPVLLTLVAPPQPVVTPPAPKPVPKPVQQPVRKAVTPLHHVVHATPPKPAPLPVPKPVVPPPPALPAVAPTDPAPPARPVPPPPPAAAPAAAKASPSFEGAMRAAIQAALRYPESARMAGMSGRARVAFAYRDGTVSGARVVVSSGIGMLDRAALAAVRDAHYPKPDAALAGKTLYEQLWVTFDLDTSDE